MTDDSTSKSKGVESITPKRKTRSRAPSIKEDSHTDSTTTKRRTDLTDPTPSKSQNPETPIQPQLNAEQI